MVEQSFAFSDIGKVVLLAFLEILLSADNAIVLGIVIRPLPVALRQKALLIGVFSAFLLRALALVSVAYLFKQNWIQWIGAAYLIYLSIAHFTKKVAPAPPKPTSFWKTVLLIELLDLVFAIDSIVAGIAFIDFAFTKLWIVYLGGVIGLFGMRFAANLFGKWLDRFPRLETSAYLMVGLIGIKLALVSFGIPVHPLIFWVISGLLFLLGFIKPRK